MGEGAVRMKEGTAMKRTEQSQPRSFGATVVRRGNIRLGITISLALGLWQLHRFYLFATSSRGSTVVPWDDAGQFDVAGEPQRHIMAGGEQGVGSGSNEHADNEDDDEGDASAVKQMLSEAEGVRDGAETNIRIHGSGDSRAGGGRREKRPLPRNAAPSPHSSDDGHPEVRTERHGIVPPFDNVHDFSTGPRPRRSRAGFSQSELRDRYEGGRTDAFAGTVQCKPNGAAYGAAWLSTMKTFLSNVRFHEEKLSPDHSPNMEYGTYAALVEGRKLYKTVDMFDFFVHHLSNYHKRIRKKQSLGDGSGIFDILKSLDDMEQGFNERGHHNPSGEHNGNVVAIMPFYASSQGSSRSNLDMRLKYLKITVKTVSDVFPNIVVCVCTMQDFNYVTHESGLNRYLYDVLLLSDLNQTTKFLPHYTGVRSRQWIEEGRWDPGFEWVYYTETDNIPQLRDINQLLYLTLEENAVVVPHRGVPVPLQLDFNVSSMEHKHDAYFNETGSKAVRDVPDILSFSCCFDRSLVCERRFQEWNRFSDPEVQLFRQPHSWAYVAGRGNNVKRRYRPCDLADGRSLCVSPLEKEEESH